MRGKPWLSAAVRSDQLGVFCLQSSAGGAQGRMMGRAVGYGRSPDDIVILPGISAAIGSTTRETELVWEELEALTSTEVGLTRLLARFAGHDFSGVPLDRPLTTNDFPDLNEVEASKSRVIGYIDMTLRESLHLGSCFENWLVRGDTSLQQERQNRSLTPSKTGSKPEPLMVST